MRVKEDKMGSRRIENKGRKRKLGCNNLAYMARRLRRKVKVRNNDKTKGEVWEEGIEKLSGVIGALWAWRLADPQ